MGGLRRDFNFKQRPRRPFVIAVPSHAARALGWSARDRTTASTVWFLRNDSRLVPKWYSSAPNGSGRIDTRGSTRQARSRSNVTALLVDAAHAVDRDLFDE